MINQSWQLCPWADVLYGCDGAFWKCFHGVPDFAGLKLAHETEVTAQYIDIHKIDVETHDYIIVERPAAVGSGGNSGFQALNLAVQFGSRYIILVGYDMRRDFGIHWYGENRGPGMRNPEQRHFLQWRRAFDNSATILKDLGVTVVNVSDVSTIQAFPKMTFEEALQNAPLSR